MLLDAATQQFVKEPRIIGPKNYLLILCFAKLTVMLMLVPENISFAFFLYW